VASGSGPGKARVLGRPRPRGDPVSGGGEAWASHRRRLYSRCGSPCAAACSAALPRPAAC